MGPLVEPVFVGDERESGGQYLPISFMIHLWMEW